MTTAYREFQRACALLRAKRQFGKKVRRKAPSKKKASKKKASKKKTSKKKTSKKKASKKKPSKKKASKKPYCPKKPCCPIHVIDEGVTSTIRDLTGGPGHRLWLSDLRATLPHVPRTALDDSLKRLQINGRIVLYRADDPTDLTATRIQAALTLAPGVDRHIVYLI